MTNGLSLLSRSFLMEGGCRCRMQDFPARCTCSTASNVVPYKCPLYSICSINCLLFIPPENYTKNSTWIYWLLLRQFLSPRLEIKINFRQIHHEQGRERQLREDLRSISGRVTNTRSLPFISACFGDRVVWGMGDAQCALLPIRRKRSSSHPTPGAPTIMIGRGFSGSGQCRQTWNRVCQHLQQWWVKAKKRK